MKRYLVFILCFLSLAGYGQQTVTYDTTILGWNAIVTRHVNHWDMDSTQAIVFSPGAGEDGTNINLLRVHGPHYEMLRSGWDGSVILGNGVHYPVIISAQQGFSAATNAQMVAFLNAVLNIFKIRRNGIRGPGLPDLHLTGISQGGFYSTRVPAYMQSASDYSNYRLVNSMWIISGVGTKFAPLGAQPLAWPRMFGHWAKNYRGRILYVYNTNDAGHNSEEYIKSMNDSMPGSAVRLTTSFGGASVGCGHCMFDETYKMDQTWTIDHPEVDQVNWYNTAGTQTTPATSLNMNWAQWLLRNGDTTLSGGNSLPVVNTGANQEITLPTNSVNLDGDATDADGTIVSYLWEKISGPDTYSFGDATDATTTFSGLVSGTYVIRLTATDNDGGVSSAIATITVNPEPGNTAPTADAGGDKAITLPTNSIELVGTGSDVEGSVSYQWTKISGGAATIESPTSATTVISGLSQGSYVFQFAVEDADGSVTTDQVTITVSGATGANKTINVSLDGASNYIKDPAWNSWLSVGNYQTPLTSQQFKYSDGSQSTITATMSKQTAIPDNTASYGGFDGWPDSALRYVSSAVGPRSLVINGLDNSKFYNLLFVCSRNSAGYRTKITINGDAQRVTSSGNKDTMVVFPNIVPSSGQVVAQIDSAYDGQNWNHLNGFTIIEINSEGGNQNPIANAGDDQVIKLPIDTVLLDGTQSVDPDGSIVEYEWTQISGPNDATIETPTADQTVVSGLIRGTYWFRLKVTDDLAGESFNEVMVRVNSEENEPPVVFSGNDTTISVESYTLSGTASDFDGTIASHAWTLYSGPTGSTIENEGEYETVVNDMEVGEYKFVLTATDNDGGVGTDTITVTVIEPPVINCLAKAGPDRVITRGTGMILLDGSESFAEEITYNWQRLTTVDATSKVHIKHTDSAIATVQVLPFGSYAFELTVTGADGCVSKDTVNITVAWGTLPPQSINPTGWRKLTAADTVTINAKHGIGYANVGDVMVDGANTGTITGGRVDINLIGNLTMFPGTKMFIRGGRYRQIRIAPSAGNCVGSAEQPLIFTNYEGQVEAQNFVIQDIKNAKFTGKYVKGVTGDSAYQGHANGRYAFSRGTYGFFSNNSWSSLGTAGVRVLGATTDSLEFEYWEVGNGNFAGWMIKHDNSSNNYHDFNIHDCYTHDIHGEGMYLGSTGAQPQNLMINWRVYNNRNIFAGNEIFQFNQIGRGTKIHNNILIGSALNRKGTFARFQSNGNQIAASEGNVDFYNNISLGMGETMFNFFAGSRTGSTIGNDTVYLRKNLNKYSSGKYGSYGSDGSNVFSGMAVKIEDNWWGGFSFRGDEYYTGTEGVNASTMFYTDANPPKFIFRNNVMDGSGGKTVLAVGIGLDSSGNTTGDVPDPQFVNSGWPVDFNWNYFEVWNDSIYKTWNDGLPNQVGIDYGAPVVYDSGAVVTLFSKYYRSKKDNNHAHMPAGATDEWWELLTWTGPGGQVYEYPPDDYRLVNGSFYDQLGMGLQDKGSAVRPPIKRVNRGAGRIRFYKPD